MEDKIVERIVAWLQKQIDISHTSGFILGLSGGLDSSVCAALIKKVSDNCLGLLLPIESSLEDCDDAAMVASQFGLRTEYVDLTNVYETMIKLLPGNNNVAQGNIKARLRMVVIYYYANINNYLVCGTGNKTELTLGYFTKFGDGACDVLPLGDLYKFQVKAIARQLEIPEKILKKVPSAGLWQGQTDEKEIGFSYEEIDKALQALTNGPTTGGCAETLQAMVNKSEHKRQPPRICKIEVK